MVVDPFSAVVNALQVADVATTAGARIIRFIRDLREANVTADGLFENLDHLKVIVETIKTSMGRRHEQEPLKPVNDDEKKIMLKMQSLLKCCESDLESFAERLESIGPGNSSLYGRTITQFKLDWNERKILKLERNVYGNITLLQTFSSYLKPFVTEATMTPLAINNESTAHHLEAMQSDISALRKALERLSRASIQSPVSSIDLHGEQGVSDEVDTDGAMLNRMKNTLDVAESLYEKFSTCGSVVGRSDSSDSISEALDPQDIRSDVHTEIGTVYQEDNLRLQQPDVSDGGVALDIPEHGHGVIPVILGDPQPLREVPILGRYHQLQQPSRTYSLSVLPLETIEDMVENYRSQATKDLTDDPPRYVSAEFNLQHALDYGEQREQAYQKSFTERFDISIKLAKAQIGQKKYKSAEHTLQRTFHLTNGSQGDPGRLNCALAKLYRAWYRDTQEERLLQLLETYATQSYFIASQSTVSPQPFLEESVQALIDLFTWRGDHVGAKTFQTRHPSVSGVINPALALEIQDGPRTISEPPSLTRGSVSEVSASSPLDGPPPAPQTGYKSGTEHREMIVTADCELLLSAAKAKSKLLVQNHVTPANVHARDSKQRTALHLALHGTGGQDVIPILFEYGADVNARDQYGTSPLHICAEFDNVSIAKQLISRGAKVDAIDKASETPLQVAIRKKKLRMVQALLPAGAKVAESRKSTGSREIDFVIQEYLANNSDAGTTVSSRSRTGSIMRGFRLR
ncbi:hypothetical protein NA57DRAFT_57713 [Rhizodiscina lignyota]|uniref:Ankyrin repeat protein n=1 Tax=Rhizodiscina lignyota TaxID=1504668 RepID=A0A9P4ID71_9PEZI|nr:hypothetical protein NA57DRAFT_57713 [Rhizodiscina lignyota]